MQDWISANGGIFDAVEVPVTFPGGEVGVAARRDIPARTAAICIPGRCIISDRKALSSEFKPIYAKHHDLFKTGKLKQTDEWTNVLGLYVLHELLKKEKSFYYSQSSIGRRRWWTPATQPL